MDSANYFDLSCVLSPVGRAKRNNAESESRQGKSNGTQCKQVGSEKQAGSEKQVGSEKQAGSKGKTSGKSDHVKNVSTGVVSKGKTIGKNDASKNGA